MIINSQRTVYGLDLQLALLTNTPYTPLPNTTLNEKFSIIPGEKLSEGEYPHLKYYTIGVGGANIVTGIDSYNFSKHKPIDAGLFEHVPFIIRPVNNDLTLEERAKYRFRRNELINGIEYICYYLKLIPTINLNNALYKVTVNDTVTRLSKFDTNTDKLLNPIPRDPSSTITNTDIAEYVAKVAKLEFSLLKDEKTELNNVLNTIYGVGHNKAITEIGVCSGVDKSINNAFPEAGLVQINYHMEVNISDSILMANATDLIRTLEIGGMEPLVL